MAPRAKIVCYFDIVSPYSYIGVTLLNRYKALWTNVDVELEPVFLAGIMSGSKNQPPATVAAKGSYMAQDLEMIATIAGIPYSFPSQFPIMTVPVMRLLVAVKKHAADKYDKCIEKEEYWVHDHDIVQKDVLLAALAPILGTSKVDEYFQMTSEKDIKQQLIDNTNKALDAGAFGAPTFIVKKAGSDEEKMFFGSDRFELMSSFLGVPYFGLTPKNMSKL
ncbi:Glutathione S-transferase kappa 1 [Haplosporangium sp. Z 767]|nr:Glutathione S-transferase kappa 1 [Haplosporangium sp. Z 11]KAF9180516.1 Glutathione S-transferase kappa 1 [Haplosporangium sp. Z 767]